MQFVRQNLANTSTMIVVGSNTDTAEYIINKNTKLQYVTNGFNDDNTTASVVINFDSTTMVDTIVLQNHNLKSFSIFYNGDTSTAINVTSNSSVNYYANFAQVGVTSVTLDMKTTIVANSEKAVGLMLVTSELLDLDRLPSSDGYKPKIEAVQKKSTLANGGVKLYNIAQKFKCEIELEYVPLATQISLKNIFDNYEKFNFIPFPTSTSWDGICYEVVWSDDFEFYQYSDNVTSVGFSGKIKLEETP